MLFALLVFTSCKSGRDQAVEQNKQLKSFVSVTDDDSVFYNFSYDERGHISGATMSAFINISFTRDENGRVETKLIMTGNGAYAETYLYDAMGRLVRRIPFQEGPQALPFDSFIYNGDKIQQHAYFDDKYLGLKAEYEVDPHTKNIMAERNYLDSGFYELKYLYDNKINPFHKFNIPLIPHLPVMLSPNNIVRRVLGENTTAKETPYAADDTLHYTYDEEGYPLTEGKKIFTYE